MDKQEAVYIGETVKIHGRKGEVVVFLDMNDTSSYSSLKFFFIDIHERLIPFHILNIEISDEYASVTFEDINSPEKAQELINRKVYLPSGQFPDASNKKFDFNELKGYQIIDENEGELGIITDILERTEQPLFQILNSDSEILIPIVDEFISDIDKKKKIITINTPPGLIDLNT